MEKGAFIPTIEEIVFNVILVIFSAFIGVVFQRWHSKKGQALSENADMQIEVTHKETIGELRQGDRSKVIIINQPTFAIRELSDKPITILKRESKTRSVLRPATRKEEISGVKFTYIRDLADKALETINWLDKDFDQALRAAIAYYTSGSNFDETKYPPKIVQYFKEMKDIHENDRLTHLIIPRIMIINEFDIPPHNKWTLLEDYYKGVQQVVHGSMLFVAEKDPQAYVDKLVKDYVQTRRLNHIIIEARGENINNASKTIGLFISDNRYGWFITRTDFCLHSFQGEDGQVRTKIWVEMTLAPENEKTDFFRKQAETRDFISYLESHAQIIIDYDYHMKHERISLYEKMRTNMESFGFTVLIGIGKYIHQTLFLASVFRSYHPQFDYVADLDSLEHEIDRIAILFSSEEISSLFRKFMESRSNKQTDK